MRRTKHKPRTPSGYDNRIHGHEYYGDPRPGETEAERAARTRVWCAISNAPSEMKDVMWGLLNPPPAAKPEADALTTVYYHGHDGRGYSIDGRVPVVVSNAAHSVLQAFLKTPTAMTRAELESASGYLNAPQIIRRLREGHRGLFRAAVPRPIMKSNGGYFIRVQPAP